MSLPERVAVAMDAIRPGWRAEAGVVAVSGGADSVALLRLFAEIASEGLIVAHVNHVLRGAESDADEAFVIELCQRMNVPVRTARIPVPPGNIEGEARITRYTFFEQIAAEMNAGWIATAHTLDDQAETVMHRLIRGTGIQGLRGIAKANTMAAPPPDSLRESTSPTGGEAGKPKSLLSTSPPVGEVAAFRGGWGVTLLRPLLDIRRSELREYLASIQQPFREDSSNADPRFTRNRIRHELLPLLETFNPQIAEVLHRLSHQATELHDSSEQETAVLLMDVELPRAGTMLIFDAEKLASLNKQQRRAVLRMTWQREGWPEQSMTFAHWSRLAELGTTDFPGGIRARRIGAVLQLSNS